MADQLHTDQELLNSLKSDSEKAFRAIYQRYGRRCFGLAFQKLRSKEAAEEITQNIFISLWERRHQLAIQNLESYLMVSVKYQTLNYIESKLTREKFSLTLPSQYAEGSSENTVENTVFVQDLMNALENALNSLPEKTCEAYRLSRFENLSGKEIAERMNLSEKSVEYHISQSLKFLRSQLKDFIAVCVLLTFI